MIKLLLDSLGIEEGYRYKGRKTWTYRIFRHRIEVGNIELVRHLNQHAFFPWEGRQMLTGAEMIKLGEVCLEMDKDPTKEYRP